MTRTITIKKPKLNTGRTGPMLEATRLTLKAITGPAVVAAPEDKRLRQQVAELKAEQQRRYNAAAQWLCYDGRAAWRVKYERHMRDVAAAERGYHHTTTVVALTSDGIGILDRVR